MRIKDMETSATASAGGIKHERNINERNKSFSFFKSHTFFRQSIQQFYKKFSADAA